MSLERYDAILDLSDRNIILGPRKCCATECVLENRDPLAYRKKRKELSTDVTVSNACVDEGDHTSPSMPPQLPVAHTKCSDNRPSGKAPVIVVEDSDKEESNNGSNGGESTEEDDEAELSMCPVTLVDFWAIC